MFSNSLYFIFKLYNSMGFGLSLKVTNLKISKIIQIACKFVKMLWSLFQRIIKLLLYTKYILCKTFNIINRHFNSIKILYFS